MDLSDHLDIDKDTDWKKLKKVGMRGTTKGKLGLVDVRLSRSSNSAKNIPRSHQPAVHNQCGPRSRFSNSLAERPGMPATGPGMLR